MHVNTLSCPSVGVFLSPNGCFVYPAYCPRTAGTGSSLPATLVWVSESDNGRLRILFLCICMSTVCMLTYLIHEVTIAQYIYKDIVTLGGALLLIKLKTTL